MSHSPALKIVSELPGRIRWEAPSLRQNPAAAQLIEETLRQRPGVIRVEASSLSGRVLILFQEKVSPDSLASSLARLLGVSLASPAGRPQRSRERSPERPRLAELAPRATKPGTRWHDLKSLTEDLRAQWPLFTRALLLDVAANVAGLGRPLAIGFALDAAVSGGLRMGGAFLRPRRALVLMAGLGIASTALRGWLRYRSQVVWNEAVRASQHTLRLRLFEHAERLQMPYLAQNTRSHVLSVLNDDMAQTERALEATWTLGDLLVNSGVLWGSLFFRSRVMALVALAPVPVILLLSRRFYPRIQSAFAQVRAQAGRLSAEMTDSINGVSTIKGFTAERRELEHLRAASERYQDTSADAIGPISGFPILLDATMVSLLILVNIAIGGALLAPVGSIGDFSILANQLSGLFHPLLHIGPLLDTLERGLAGYDRIRRLLEAPVEPGAPAGAPLHLRGGEVVYRGVEFAYPGSRPLFRNLSMRFAPGGTTAVVGLTGSGKSTLVWLLMRFYSPQSGAIELDGQDITRADREQVRRSISLVSQDVFLFNRTVLENIGIGREGASFEEIVAAAKLAQAHGFISRLPQGYQTVLGERGERLSGGERQRIAIARAILKDAPILVLDEATSSIDSETELALQHALHAWAHGRTIIKIAHRLSTVRDAQRIYVLEHGEVVEHGTHDELVSRGERYASLWHSQLGEA